jgi:hypothetical protein
MGKYTRVGDVLPKTEVKKGIKTRKDYTQVTSKSVDEDVILSLIETKKVGHLFFPHILKHALLDS